MSHIRVVYRDTDDPVVTPTHLLKYSFLSKTLITLHSVYLEGETHVARANSHPANTKSRGRYSYTLEGRDKRWTLASKTWRNKTSLSL